MHNESYEAAKKFKNRYLPESLNRLTFLEVGSLNVNGSLRSVFSKTKKYTGVDIVSGRDVDIVLKDPHKLPFNDSEFDMVVSASTMEHVEYFWEAFKEQGRVLKPGGYIYMYVPFKEAIHHRPDRWRVTPDGCKALANYAGLLFVDAYIDPSRYVASVFQKNK